MNWINFPVFGYSAVAFLAVTALVFLLPLSKNKKRIISNVFTIIGIALLGIFITILWIKLERPPLKTKGETRLWYSFFLAAIGIVAYNRWKFIWFLIGSNFFAILFLIINLLSPETYNKTLMPALQSPWFVPHVIAYIFSYSLLGASCLVALWGLYQLYYKDYNKTILLLADNLVYIGFAFLSFGLLFGALWAKEAWGHYWTWDPKETWALLTYFSYLIYIHFRFHKPGRTKLHLWILAISFAVLLSAWFGVNYLAAAQNSVHVYSD